MSKGKMAAQVSHASMCYFTNKLKRGLTEWDNNYTSSIVLSKEIVEGWLLGSFTKVILEVKDEKGLEKVVEKAEAFGFVKGEDFFEIRDNCLTELEPDESGTCWTCIGFKPMTEEEMLGITKRLQLFKD